MRSVICVAKGIVSAQNETYGACAWTTDRIDLELARVGGARLFAVVALTALIGIYVLVLGKPGFGATSDYLLCILWGFGFSTGAGVIPNLDAGAIRAKIEIPRPA